jgi:hypothetical protein
MSYAFIVIVGIVFYSSGAIDKVVKPQPKSVAEVVVAKPLKVKAKQPEPIKEEVKAELEKAQPITEPIKEEVKAELEKQEPIKEIIKEETKVEPTEPETEEEIKAEPTEPEIKEVKVNDPESGYLKIILYIIGAISVIFGGFYFFSSRGNNQTLSSTVDTARKDIEESYQPESQEQQPAQEETQTETQEQQPAQEETQTETQEQQPAQEETQSETEEQLSTEDENKIK